MEPDVDIFLESDAEADSEREGEPEEAPAERDRIAPRGGRPDYKALVQKLHVNTGHASVPQMLRLAQRARAPYALVQAIRAFKCPMARSCKFLRHTRWQHCSTPKPRVILLALMWCKLSVSGILASGL